MINKGDTVKYTIILPSGSYEYVLTCDVSGQKSGYGYVKWQKKTNEYVIDYVYKGYITFNKLDNKGINGCAIEAYIKWKCGTTQSVVYTGDLKINANDPSTFREHGYGIMRFTHEPFILNDKEHIRSIIGKWMNGYPISYCKCEIGDTIKYIKFDKY
jgi:hypothetical protein